MAYLLRTIQSSSRRAINLSRLFSSKEEAMKNTLVSSLDASHCVVEDVSGGCGSMYKLEVESKQFKGLRLAIFQ